MIPGFNNQDLAEQKVIYEVNLTIDKKVFEANRSWLLSHFNDMVDENAFLQADIYTEVITDPTDDDHMRYYRLIAHYIVPTYQQMEAYFIKNANKMRSQVVARLGCHYQVSRRVLTSVQTYSKQEQ